MRVSTNWIGLVCVAGLAFAAGRAGLPDSASAAAQPEGEGPAGGEAPAWMEAGTPGPEHELLAKLAGEWEGVVHVRMGPDEPFMESSGRIRRELVLGGRFLSERVDAEMEMGTLRGISYMGFNRLTGQYESLWMDNFSTPMFTETARYDAEAKVLHARGTVIDPATGRHVPQRSRIDLSDPDRHVMHGYSVGPHGKEYTSFEGVFERVGD